MIRADTFAFAVAAGLLAAAVTATLIILTDHRIGEL